MAAVREELPIEVFVHAGARRLKSASAGVFSHVNAHSGKVQAQIPMAGAEEVHMAAEAAWTAFNDWRRWKPTERRDALLRLASIVRSKASEFARMITLENGTAIVSTELHAETAYSWLTYYAGWADKIEGLVSSTFTHRRDFCYCLPEPIGVIGAIIPWNGPLHSLGMKVGPVLAAGNTLVLKPSEFAPFSAELFARCIREAGIPDGVCNILPGAREAGEALVRHPRIEKISFTGGFPTAQRILMACAETAKPALLELGGKSANLVFADADLDSAARHATTFSLQVFSGQGCIFPTRLLVEESVYDTMVERCVALARAIPMGDPFDRNNTMGPVISFAAAERIVGISQRATKEGDGQLVTGGRRAGGSLAEGAYVEPTIFARVSPTSRLAQEEIFGPVLSIIPFKTEEEAIKIANDTKYGLGAYLHSRDVSRVHRVSSELRAGGIFVNGGAIAEPDTTFGGLGISGYGREGGKAGIDEYLRMKTVSIAP